MVLMFVAVLTPLVEELYFRGYLLPRMKGEFATLFHSFLFAAQHVLEPWMIIPRTLAWGKAAGDQGKIDHPETWSIRRRKNEKDLYIHCYFDDADSLYSAPDSSDA